MLAPRNQTLEHIIPSQNRVLSLHAVNFGQNPYFWTITGRFDRASLLANATNFK